MKDTDPAGGGPPDETWTDAGSTRDRMRSQIVEVAAGLLARGGREAVSTRAVAAAAGTQGPTIYRLFGDKDGLLAAVLEYGVAKYLSGRPVVESGADPVARLRADWDRDLGFGLANPALFRLMYVEAVPGRPSAAAEAALSTLRTRIRGIAAAGRLRVDEELAVAMVQAAGCGAIFALVAVPEERRDPRLAEAMFDAVVAAITTGEVETRNTRPTTAANALRAQLPDLEMLTDGERQLLGEWLVRITH